jgi:hypothetical protein
LNGTTLQQARHLLSAPVSEATLTFTNSGEIQNSHPQGDR